MRERKVNDRWHAAISGSATEAVKYAADSFVAAANAAIEQRGAFFAALSGGSTPAAIYRELGGGGYDDKVDWSRVWLFWSDERAVPPTDEHSNYRLAMTCGMKKLPIPLKQIWRMPADVKDLDTAAKSYEEAIVKFIPDRSFDLMMLGMGEDGHTASLFPGTEALKNDDRLCVANYLPEKEVWRMTLTYPCINNSRAIAIYILGSNKAQVLSKVFSQTNGSTYPIQKVGTATHPATWIMDEEAAAQL